jgi:hypothetical protein
MIPASLFQNFNLKIENITNGNNIDVKQLGQKLYLDYDFSKELEHFNDNDKNLILEIVSHNQQCDKDPLHNNIKFWKDIISRAKYPDDIFGAIVISPHSPKEIIEDIVMTSNSPKVLLEVLKKDIEFDKKIYDKIQQKIKYDISKVLYQCYSGVQFKEQPFNQKAINYYAKKYFNKTKVQKDKMLITLAYSDDKDFLDSCINSPLLNEVKATYLVNNIHIDENKRNEMFIYNDINCSLLKRPTPYMIDEFYRINSDGYFMTNDKKQKNTNLSNIGEMLEKGLLTEGMEKDIIAKYQKGDKDYRCLIKKVISKSKNMGTLEYASSLNPQFFDNAFYNPNITKDFLKEYGLKHMDHAVAGVKRTGNVSQHLCGIQNIIDQIELTSKQYEIITNSKDEYLHKLLITSPCTPMSVLEKISLKKDKEMEKISLVTTLRIKMKEKGFEDSQIIPFCKDIYYFTFNLSPSNNKYYCEQITSDLVDFDKEGILQNVIEIIEDLKQTFSQKDRVIPHLNAILNMSLVYLQDKDKVDIISKKEKDKLYDYQNEIISKFKGYQTMWNMYANIDKYGQAYIDVTNAILNCKNPTPSTEKIEYIDEPDILDWDS